MCHRTINYSDKVYIDIKNILDIANDEDIFFIWNNLLYISKLFNPSLRQNKKHEISSNLLENTLLNISNKDTVIVSIMKSMLKELSKSI